MQLHLEGFVPTKFCSLCLLHNPVQLDSLMEGLGAMPIFSCTPDNGSVFCIFKKRSWCWWGWTKFMGWSCSSTSFVGLDFLPSFCKCSAPPQHVYHDMLWWILLLAMQCRWAEMGSDITHKGQGFAPLYRFDFCQFPSAVSCRHCITPTEGMNSWKIPSYVFNPGSGFSNVSDCLLSIWWNHVHGGSQFRRKTTSTSSGIIVTYSHDCVLCYHNVCLFVTWSQVKLRINLFFRNGCWVGCCPVSINRWCCVAWAKYDRSSKMSPKMSLFSCILILVSGKTISRGGSWKSLFSWCTLEQVLLSSRATDLVL